MKKSLKPVILLLLFAYFLSTSAFAAGGSCKVKEQIKYVSLGDSIADGIGLPDNPLRGPDQPDKTKVYCHKTIGAYPSLVAAALGVRDENFAQLACAGMGTGNVGRKQQDALPLVIRHVALHQSFDGAPGQRPGLIF